MNASLIYLCLVQVHPSSSCDTSSNTSSISLEELKFSGTKSPQILAKAELQLNHALFDSTDCMLKAEILRCACTCMAHGPSLVSSPD